MIKVLPIALFGSSTTAEDWSAVDRLTTAIVNNNLGKADKPTGTRCRLRAHLLHVQ